MPNVKPCQSDNGELAEQQGITGYSQCSTRNEASAVYWLVATSVDLLDLPERSLRKGNVRFTAAEVEVLGQETESVDGDADVEVAVNEALSPTLAVLDELSANGTKAKARLFLT